MKAIHGDSCLTYVSIRVLTRTHLNIRCIFLITANLRLLLTVFVFVYSLVEVELIQARQIEAWSNHEAFVRVACLVSKHHFVGLLEVH